MSTIVDSEWMILVINTVQSRDGQTARASSKLEPKMASFHSSAPAPKKNSRAKKLGSGSKIENQSQKARLWLQNKTNQSQMLGSGSRIFLRLDHQWPKCYISIGNVCGNTQSLPKHYIGNFCGTLNHYQSITLVMSEEHSTITNVDEEIPSYLLPPPPE